MGTHSQSTRMHTRLLVHYLVILSLYVGYIHGDSEDLVEGSGDDDDQSLAITQAVKKVAELVDEVASDLNDNIDNVDNLEVNLEENEIQDDMKIKKKKNKKCKKCVKRVFRARNSALCKQCDDESNVVEDTTANTTPASTTPPTTTSSTTTMEPTTTSMSEKLNYKRIQKIKERCEKCQKKHFRARNSGFCETKCVMSGEMMDTTEIVTNNVEVTTDTEMEAENTTSKARKHNGRRKNKQRNKNRKNRVQKNGDEAVNDNDEIVLTNKKTENKVGP